MSISLFLLVSSWIMAFGSGVNPDTVKRNDRVELILQNDRAVSHPHRDVQVWIEFKNSETSQTEKVRAFWNGENQWKVRFKPHISGHWQWVVSDDSYPKEAFTPRIGTFYVSTEVASRPPRLLVAESGRTLTTLDKTPFFWLGDTAWEITWKSHEQQMLDYLDDRQAKGFTVIQVVVMSHQRFYDYGVRNRMGHAYFINNDHSRLNPDYFHYLDRIVEEANERGMVVALVPLWAHMMELHHMPQYHDYTISKENALFIADYVGARYAGNDVIWIVGGDNAYDSAEKRAFWNEWAQRLDAASGEWHLMTVHTKGHTSSFDFFDSSLEWLDFHMYQSGHLADGDYTWKAARKGWNLTPVKPIVNGEPNYEDIYNKLWQPADTSFTETYRIQPEHVRRASWESVLSGSTMGISYGANGVWQWNTNELPGTHFPRYQVEQAIQFAGSSHMRILKEIAVKYDFHNWRPMETIVQAPGKTRIAHVENRNGILAYIPVGVSKVTLHLNESIARYDGIELRNPADPQHIPPTYHLETGPFKTDISLPNSSQDWILFVPFTSPIQGEYYPESVSLKQNYPNPFNPTTTIDFTLHDFEYVQLEVFDITGQRVRTLLDGGLTPGFHSIQFDASGLASGFYLYRLSTAEYSQAKTMHLLK